MQACQQCPSKLFFNGKSTSSDRCQRVMLRQCIASRVLAINVLKVVKSQFGKVWMEYFNFEKNTHVLWKHFGGLPDPREKSGVSFIRFRTCIKPSVFDDLRIEELVCSGGWLLPDLSFRSPSRIVFKGVEDQLHAIDVPKEEPHRLARFSTHISCVTGEKLIAAEELYLANNPAEKLALLVYGDAKRETLDTVKFQVKIFADGVPIIHLSWSRDVLQNISRSM